MFTEQSFIPFTQALYSQYERSKGESNFIISPLSIYSALSLALVGSANQSKNELTKALRLDEKMEHKLLHKTLAENLQSVSKGDTKKTLQQANGIFKQIGGKVLPEFSNTITKDFASMTRELDFGKSEEARSFINNWVSDVTKQKIPNLMPSGSISPQTQMVLVNALYFKGAWKDKFNPKATKEEDFKGLHKKIMKVQMMQRKDNYKVAYFDDIDARAAKIPFEHFEMIILLPNKDDGLPNILKKLSESPDQLKKILTSKEYYGQETVLKMPKFFLGGESFSLKSEFQNMGLKSIFNRDADFSGITGDRSLFVSDVYHQAMIEVDEKGAEAAAGTAMGIMLTSLPTPPEYFQIDHPFLFFITTPQGLPVFMGHVVEPKLK